MRTILLIIAMIVVVVLATFVYVWMQPATIARKNIGADIANRAPEFLPATTQSSDAVLHAGQNVWLKIPDAKANRIAWQFRASRYDPQPDGTVTVINPEAQFFLTSGEVVSIRGTHGSCVEQTDITKGTQMRGVSGPPSRGELYDVSISLFPTQKMEKATLVCNMNNVAFDNDTYRIATEAFTDATGNLVPADEVPVQIRGDEYDFDGRGLVIRWNDLNRRLQSLQIAHGESLTIKPAATTQKAPPPPPPAKPIAMPTRPKPRAKSPVTRPAAGEVAEVNPETPAAATEPTTAPTTQKTPVIYRATFDGGVIVTQGNQPVSRSDTLAVEFSMEDQNGATTKPAASGAATPKTKSAKSAPAKTPGGSILPHPATVPVTQPTKSKDQLAQGGPIVVRWPGQLNVVPIETDPPKLGSGQRNLFLASEKTPVVLNHNGGEVRCASFFYGGADDSLHIRNSVAVPIISMRDPTGATLLTPSFDYDGTAGKAVLKGASQADAPLRDQATGVTQIMHAHWNDLCVLTIDKSASNGKTGAANDQSMSIKQADLSGDVHIDHPKLALRSDTLQVAFAPQATATTKPTTSKSGSSNTTQLKQVLADGGVICDLHDEQQGERHITTDHLKLDTETVGGQTVPRVMTAEGNVHTFDDQHQDLRAGELIATLAPTTRPTDQVQMQNIFAQHDVKFAFKDASGTCEQLTATTNGDDYDIKLLAQPAATITTKNSTLAGPIIIVQPKRQYLEVAGAGSLRGTQQETPTSKAQPFDVTWSDSMNFQGAQNVAHVNGNVNIVTVASDGTHDTATGQTLLMTFIDDPKATTKPTTKPASTRRAASNPSTNAATKPSKKSRASTQPSDGDPMAGFGSMGSKQLREMILSGDSQIQSVLLSPAGEPVRRLHLFAPAVRMDAINKKMTVPSAGRMLYEDRRATTQPTTQSTTQASTTQPTTSPASPLGGLSGATAFSWQKQLTFDQLQNRTEMLGDVVIVHQALGSANSEPFRLEANRVTADLDTSSVKTSKSSTKPSNSSDAKIKMLSADGDVRFMSRQIQFEASQMNFDPATETLHAAGSDRLPMQMFDDRGVSSGMIQEAWWNTRTQQITLRDLQGQVER